MRRPLTLVLMAAAAFGLTAGAMVSPSAALTAAGCGSGISAQDRLVYVRVEQTPDGAASDIWAMRGDGSRVRNLTNTLDVWEGEPTWAPNGERIAFHSERAVTTPFPPLDPLFTPANLDPRNPDIEVINVDGTGRTNLTNTPLFKEVKPSWSPDGLTIVFEAGQPAVSTAAPNDDIWVMDANGSYRRRLTTEPGREWFPSWSPDSRRIAFMSGRDGNFEIYVMAADGSGQTRITANATEDATPTWSPNGSRVAYPKTDAVLVPTPGIFISLRDATRADIVSIRQDGSDPVAIIHQGLQAEPDYRSCH